MAGFCGKKDLEDMMLRGMGEFRKFWDNAISAQSNLWITCTQRGTLLNERNGFAGITEIEEAWNWDQFVDKS
ncbi:hypothetical protein WN943_006522 [Citrus x changshan-huyou]